MLSSACTRVSYDFTGMKNGIPKRNPEAKSIPVSGKGRPAGVEPGISGPEYGRGLSSRANWNLNSLSIVLVRWDTRLPLIAFEKSFSIALELRPQVSTSNVPFSWRELV